MKRLIGAKKSYKRTLKIGRYEISLMTLFADDSTRTHDHCGPSWTIMLSGRYAEKHYKHKMVEDLDILARSYHIYKYPLLGRSFIPKGDFHSITGIAPKTRLLNLTKRIRYARSVR